MLKSEQGKQVGTSDRHQLQYALSLCISPSQMVKKDEINNDSYICHCLSDAIAW